MGANIAGIYGAQIFREDDKPRYRRGFSIGIGVLVVGLCLAVVRFVDDRLRRRRSAKQVQNESASDQNSENEDTLTATKPNDAQAQTVLYENDLKTIVPNITK